MQGKPNSTVTYLPRTIPKMDKGVLWSNTRQQRFDRKQVDNQPVRCCRDVLPFPKREVKSPRRAYQVSQPPRQKESCNWRRNHLKRVREPQRSQRWSTGRVGNYGWHEWPRAERRATHANSRSVWVVDGVGTGRSKTNAHTWKGDFEDRRDSQRNWMNRRIPDE